jgi:hypothetical protein
VAVRRRRQQRKRTDRDPSEAPSALNLTRNAVKAIRAKCVQKYTLCQSVLRGKSGVLEAAGMVTGNPNAAPGRSRPAPRATSGRRGMSYGFALMPASVFPAGLFCAERLMVPAATAETRPHAGRSGRAEFARSPF